MVLLILDLPGLIFLSPYSANSFDLTVTIIHETSVSGEVPLLWDKDPLKKRGAYSRHVKMVGQRKVVDAVVLVENVVHELAG